MLANTLCRIPRSTGLHLIQQRGGNGATELTSWRLFLPAGGEEHYLNPDEETVLVLQNRRGTLRAAGNVWRVSRKSVFSERAYAVYLPPGIELTVAADASFEAILISANTEGGGQPVLIGPNDVQVNQRGKSTYV